MNKKLVLLLASALVLGACGNKEAKPAEETKQEESQVEETNTGVKEVADDNKDSSDTENKQVPEVAMNVEDAVKIFHEHNFGDGSDEAINIDKFKVKFLDKGLEYEIEGFKDGKEYKLKIDDNGNILEEEIEDDDDNKKVALDLEKLFSPTKALEKALEGQDEGTKVKEYEIKIEDGKAIYEIELNNDKDIKIDGATGEIIERE